MITFTTSFNRGPHWKSKETSYLLAHFGFIQGIASYSAGASKSGLAAEQWTY